MNIFSQFLVRFGCLVACLLGCLLDWLLGCLVAWLAGWDFFSFVQGHVVNGNSVCACTILQPCFLRRAAIGQLLSIDLLFCLFPRCEDLPGVPDCQRPAALQFAERRTLSRVARSTGTTDCARPRESESDQRGRGKIQVDTHQPPRCATHLVVDRM